MNDNLRVFLFLWLISINIIFSSSIHIVANGRILFFLWLSNTREDSTHGHHQMVDTKIRLIIFIAAKDGEAVYSQQKPD